MTNTREIEEMLPTESDLEKVGQHYWGGDYEPTYQELINLKQSFKEILTPKIEKFLHQELQKAREEERERIIHLLENIVPKEEDAMDIINDWIIPALKRAIHSELDQPDLLDDNK